MNILQLTISASLNAGRVSGHAIAQPAGARVKISGFIGKALAAIVLVCSMQVGSVGAAVIQVDGVMDDNDDYTDMLTALWVNDHKKEYSIYADGSYETVVHYRLDGPFLYLYMEAPIYAKNMIWGPDLTWDGSDGEPEEYYEHWDSHHNGTLTLDYNTATGSEDVLYAVEFGAYKGKLKLGKDTGKSEGTGYGVVDYATSLDWLLDAGTNGNTYGCTTTACAAADVTMSFEWKINHKAGGGDSFDPYIILDNLDLGDPNGVGEDLGGIQFHLSPERAAVIPVPAAVWLFGSGLLGLIGIARRKKT